MAGYSTYRIKRWQLFQQNPYAYSPSRKRERKRKREEKRAIEPEEESDGIYIIAVCRVELVLCNSNKCNISKNVDILKKNNNTTNNNKNNTHTHIHKIFRAFNSFSTRFRLLSMGPRLAVITKNKRLRWCRQPRRHSLARARFATCCCSLACCLYFEISSNYVFS